MTKQELQQARTECSVTFSKWNRDMRRLNALLLEFDTLHTRSVHRVRARDFA
jgi:hypothetical protein